MQKLFQFYTAPREKIEIRTTDVNKCLEEGWTIKEIFNTPVSENILTQIILEKKSLSPEKADVVKAAESLNKISTFGSKYGSGVGTLEDITGKFPIGG